MLSEQESTPYPAKNTQVEGIPERIAFCNRCGSGFARPAPSDKFLEHYYGDSQYWKIAKASIRPHRQPVLLAMARSRWSLIQTHLLNLNLKRDGLSLLDIGAGYGYLGIVAAAGKRIPVNRYTAVEPDIRLRNALENAWPKWGQGASLKTVGHMDKTEHQYHIVALSHVLEHVKNPVDMINCAVSFLRDGGLFFVETPHRDDLFKSDVFPHLIFFSLPGLKTLIGNSFLEIIDSDIWGRSREKSPLNHKRSKWIRRQEILLNLMTRVVSSHISSALFARHFGIDVRHERGTWIRVVARKRS
jgi:2-polyprenyl-3-methyl-5-hydroxy-6-metoxy-1,4-benzoquinol methylase